MLDNLCNMEIGTIFGSIAATLTTASFIPQVIKTIKTKDTKSISLLMYGIFVIGVAMWLIYGIMLQEIPIIVANVITLILSGTVLVFKMVYG